MRPYGFWGNLGYLGARDAPLRGFGGIWFFWGFLGLFGRTRCAPTGFGGVGRTRCAPTGFGVFWGYLGARDAPLRVLDAAEGEKPPHQVNLDTFREKIFLHRESLK
jgi:hypothetical protein